MLVLGALDLYMEKLKRSFLYKGNTIKQLLPVVL